MNDTLQAFARQSILDGLAMLPEGHSKTFKLLYGRNNGKRSIEDTVALSVADVVKMIPGDKLDWAMEQVERSIKQQDKRDGPKLPCT